jgi:hypothetical protein
VRCSPYIPFVEQYILEMLPISGTCMLTEWPDVQMVLPLGHPGLLIDSNYIDDITTSVRWAVPIRHPCLKSLVFSQHLLILSWWQDDATIVSCARSFKYGTTKRLRCVSSFLGWSRNYIQFPRIKRQYVKPCLLALLQILSNIYKQQDSTYPLS